MAAFNKSEYEALIAKLEKLAVRSKSNSSKMTDALLDAARLIEMDAKLNVRDLGLVRSDNSIMKAIETRLSGPDRVEVGTFEHRFAHVYELGLPFTDKMRCAMFAKLKAADRFDDNYTSKDRIDYARGRFRRASFLGPALEAKRDQVLKILAEAYTDGL